MQTQLEMHEWAEHASQKHLYIIIVIVVLVERM